MASKIQIEKSLTGDLQDNTWTFEMEDEMQLRAGKFAIIDLRNISITQHQKLFDFRINNETINKL